MAMSLKQLALEVYNGKNIMFNEVSGADAINNAVKDACGGTFNYYSFQQNKYKVFEVISEILELPLQQIEKEILPGICKVSTIALGDKKELVLKNKHLLRVARLSSSNFDIRRQKLAGVERVSVETADYGIAVYEELNNLLSNRVSFADFVEAINKSLEVTACKIVNKCFIDATDALSADMKVTGSFAEEELIALIEKTSAKNGGAPVKVYGTKTALAKVAAAVPTHMITDAQKEKYSTVRNFGSFYSTPLIEIAQMYDDKMQPIVDDNTLFVLCDYEYLEFVFEGAPIIMEPDNQNRNDGQVEMKVVQKMGCAAVFGKYFSAYVLA